MITRRTFLATTAAAAAAPALSTAAAGTSTSSSGKSAALFRPPDDLKPAPVDPLPHTQNKQRVKKLQETLAELDCDGILLTDRWNVIYFTGLWHTTTERLFYAFIPTKGSAPI